MACGLLPYGVMSCKHGHKCGRCGFTLMELMIVIVVMGIVTVLSVPAMGRFLQS